MSHIKATTVVTDQLRVCGRSEVDHRRRSEEVNHNAVSNVHTRVTIYREKTKQAYHTTTYFLIM